MQEKVVLITGAGRGVGRVLAESFAAHGARVCLNDISPLNVEAAAAAIQEQGGQAEVFVMDISKKMSAQALLNEVTDALGRVDVLVNAASVEPDADALAMDEWDLLRALQVNLAGAFVMTQSAARVMRAQGGGVVLNIAALAGRFELPGRAAYVASKFGLVGFTRHAAPELAAAGVRMNLLGTGLGALATHHLPGFDVAEVALELCIGRWREASGWCVDIGSTTDAR